MNILITVGTTPFDSLFECIDTSDIPELFKVKGQIAAGSYRPQRFSFFEFDHELQSHIDWADLVVCHAGAGTVYQLLEAGKKSIVVANLERIDKHQTDLVRFVSEYGYAQATENVFDVPNLIKTSDNFAANPYSKTDFFLADEISNLIRDCYQ